MGNDRGNKIGAGILPAIFIKVEYPNFFGKWQAGSLPHFVNRVLTDTLSLSGDSFREQEFLYNEASLR